MLYETVQLDNARRNKIIWSSELEVLEMGTEESQNPHLKLAKVR
jgi:hypothetical protein